MLSLPHVVTHQQARACQELLAQGLRAETGADVLVDAAAVQRFDSVALALLLDFDRRCRQQGKRCRVRGLPEGLQRLARVYGVYELLQKA